MKFKIRGEEDKKEETIEFWLEIEGNILSLEARSRLGDIRQTLLCVNLESGITEAFKHHIPSFPQITFKD